MVNSEVSQIRAVHHGSLTWTCDSLSNLSCDMDLWYHHTIPVQTWAFLGPPKAHSTLLLWRRSVLCAVSFVKIYFVPHHKWFLISIWWKFVVVRVTFYPSPRSNDGTKYLFIQIDEYEWAILSRLSSRPWYIIVIFCGNSPKIHRHGTLAKTTKYSSSPENIGLLAAQNKLWSNDPKKPQDTKLWECSHPPAGRAPTHRLSRDHNLQLITIIISDIK